jgi:hypothetical protein
MISLEDGKDKDGSFCPQDGSLILAWVMHLVLSFQNLKALSGSNHWFSQTHPNTLPAHEAFLLFAILSYLLPAIPSLAGIAGTILALLARRMMHQNETDLRLINNHDPYHCMTHAIPKSLISLGTIGSNESFLIQI